MALLTTFGLDLDEAWSRTLRRARQAEIPDILRWEDFKLAWPAIRDKLVDELDSGTYSPRSANVVEVPKDGFTVRPIAELNPRDHVVLEAVVGSIAEKIDAALPSTEELFSARFRSVGNATYKLRDQRDEWLRFQRKAREKYEDYDEAFMLSTDVASYFEYVEIEILIKELKTLEGIPHENVDLLSKVLNTIERSSDIWGLPQGFEASAILGNFYLLAVDRALVGKPVEPLRFQDDLKIFGESPAALRLALRDIIRTLRGRRLNVSVTKTKLLEGAEILAEIEDSRKDAIQYRLDVGDEDSALSELKQLFDEAVASDPISARDIRFAVYRFQKEGDPHAVPWILDNLANTPWLSELLVGYLSTQFSEEIEDKVVEYLNDATQKPLSLC